MSLHQATVFGGPMAYLHTDGPAANPITLLLWVMGIVSVVVVIVIGVLLLGAVFRRRPMDPSDAPDQLAVHRDDGGMYWIYIGVGISTVVLLVCAAWNLVTIATVTRPPTAPTLTIEVTAQQWWWALRYRPGSGSDVFLSANEIHIPVGQPVRFELKSADVIHSFWVPKLAGKMDVIPGQTNVTWLQADKPGIYRGQCAVFCGAEHARMGLLVIAQSPVAFRAWQQQQIQPAAEPETTQTRRGRRVFGAHCGACHTVRGSGVANGLVGPDLTHLMSRRTLAADLLSNTPGNLAAWIANPQGIKPGCRMPDPMLSGRDLTAVMAYLETLH